MSTGAGRVVFGGARSGPLAARRLAARRLAVRRLALLGLPARRLSARRLPARRLPARPARTGHRAGPLVPAAGLAGLGARAAASRRALHRTNRPARPAPPGVSSAGPTRVAVGSALGALVVVTVWLAAYGFVFSRVSESRSQALLYAELRSELSAATAPIAAPIPPGHPIAVLDIAPAGLHAAVVVEGTTSRVLTTGPGHLAGTPLPGQAGVSVLFGRSVTYGAPFAGVAALRPGDRISVTTGQGTFRYAVDGVRYPGDPLPPPLPAGGARMTLVTAAGGGWRAGWAPQQAVYVDATLTGTPKPASVAPVARTGPQAPMQGDPTDLVGLVLWLQCGLLLTAAAAWAARRWGGVVTAMVAVPLGAAVLWGTSESAASLLPNLI